MLNDQNHSLRPTLLAIESHRKWQSYAEYCKLREQGLRKQAFSALDIFLADSLQWCFNEQKEFVAFVFNLCEDDLELQLIYLCYPLMSKLIKPTLDKWCKQEQVNSQPFRWYGKFFCDSSYIYQALQIDPCDDKARKWIITNLLEKIDFATHHLPDYYIGDPLLAIEWGKEVQQHINLLIDKKAKSFWQQELEHSLVLVNNYIQWQASDHPDFEQWGKENKLQVDSNVETYYYQQ